MCKWFKYDIKNGTWLMGERVSCMIVINFWPHCKTNNTRIWYIYGSLFTLNTTKLTWSTILSIKFGFVNYRISMIKKPPRVVILHEICKHMIYLFQVSLSWYWWNRVYHWSFQTYIYSNKLHYPWKYTNKGLVACSITWYQFFWYINIQSIISTDGSLFFGW